MTLGKRLRMLRDKEGWTLRQVADKLGLNVLSTYSNWEYDRTDPSSEMLIKLADLYKTDVRYILTGRDPETIDYSFKLKKLLDGKDLRWDEDGKILSEDERRTAITILSAIFDK